MVSRVPAPIGPNQHNDSHTHTQHSSNHASWPCTKRAVHGHVAWSDRPQRRLESRTSTTWPRSVARSHDLRARCMSGCSFALEPRESYCTHRCSVPRSTYPAPHRSSTRRIASPGVEVSPAHLRTHAHKLALVGRLGLRLATHTPVDAAHNARPGTIGFRFTVAYTSGVRQKTQSLSMVLCANTKPSRSALLDMLLLATRRACVARTNDAAVDADELVGATRTQSLANRRTLSI